ARTRIIKSRIQSTPNPTSLKSKVASRKAVGRYVVGRQRSKRTRSCRILVIRARSARRASRVGGLVQQRSSYGSARAFLNFVFVVLVLSPAIVVRRLGANWDASHGSSFRLHLANVMLNPQFCSL
ncbi:hypothetical protein ACHAWF_011474, partial [Thalassiosira exigua]